MSSEHEKKQSPFMKERGKLIEAVETLRHTGLRSMDIVDMIWLAFKDFYKKEAEKEIRFKELEKKCLQVAQLRDKILHAKSEKEISLLIYTWVDECFADCKEKKK